MSAIRAPAEAEGAAASSLAWPTAPPTLPSHPTDTTSTADEISPLMAAQHRLSRSNCEGHFFRGRPLSVRNLMRSGPLPLITALHRLVLPSSDGHFFLEGHTSVRKLMRAAPSPLATALHRLLLPSSKGHLSRGRLASVRKLMRSGPLPSTTALHSQARHRHATGP